MKVESQRLSWARDVNKEESKNTRRGEIVIKSERRLSLLLQGCVEVTNGLHAKNLSVCELFIYLWHIYLPALSSESCYAINTRPKIRNSVKYSDSLKTQHKPELLWTRANISIWHNHSSIHSLTHSLTPSLTHSLTHLRTRSLIHSFRNCDLNLSPINYEELSLKGFIEECRSACRSE